ncbi:MAG TPA: hypothetical protein VF973_16905 [Myxococcales bacterium]
MRRILALLPLVCGCLVVHSNVKLEELALINGFDDKNGQLQAGQQYKRIVGGPPVQDKAAAGQPPKS